MGCRWRFSWQHPPLGSGWLRWDVGGSFPRNLHRLAAGGYDGMTVEIFLATSTAWQQVATSAASTVRCTSPTLVIFRQPLLERRRTTRQQPDPTFEIA
jgi:hypothetical protein